MTGYFYKGRHRAPTHTGRNAAIVTVASGVAFGGLSGTAGAAERMPDHLRAAIIDCESGGRNIPTQVKPEPGQVFTASGFYQITNPTWRDNGGTQFASRAMFASKAQQDRVADTLFAQRGTQPWDASKPCWSKRASVRTAKTAPTNSANAAKRTQAKRTTGTIVVKRGDTLSKIAKANDVQGGFKVIFDKNRDVLKNPNVIFPGQRLRLS